MRENVSQKLTKDLDRDISENQNNCGLCNNP